MLKTDKGQQASHSHKYQKLQLQSMDQFGFTNTDSLDNFDFYNSSDFKEEETKTPFHKQPRDRRHYQDSIEDDDQVETDRIVYN